MIKTKAWYIKCEFSSGFVNCLDDLYHKYGEEVFSVHGIANKFTDISRFNKDFFSNSASSKSTADVSVDANANVKGRDVAHYNFEYGKPLGKLESLFLLFDRVEKCFDTEAAKMCLEKVISGELFINDLALFHMPYCYAFDLRTMMEEGLNYAKDLGMNIRPPQRADTFINLVIQHVGYSSNQLAGAVSFPDFFIILDYFYRKEHGEDYHKELDFKSLSEKYKCIKEQFQSLIYSLNWPFRGNQSAFTNLSVLDKGFLNELFGNYVFPDYTVPNLDSSYQLSKMFHEYLSYIQGKEGMFTFPVMTIACSIDEQNNNEWLDPEFSKWASRASHEKANGNILISEPSCFSSCCFSGDEIFDVTDKFGHKTYYSARVFAESNLEKHEMEKKIGDKQLYTHGINWKLHEISNTLITGVFKKEYKGKLIQIKCGRNIGAYTPEHLFTVMDENLKYHEIPIATIYLNPDKYTIPIRGYDNKIIFVKIDDITEIDCKYGYVYCIEIEEHHYVAANNIIAHNCRLRSDFKKAGGAGFTNSFGAGGLNIGSHRVAGLNLPRIALLEEENPDIIDEDIECCWKILYAHRMLIKEYVANGYLPLYTYGWIRLSSQYSTFGFIGAYEYLLNKGKDIRDPEDRKIFTNILKKIEEKIEVYQHDYREDKVVCNIEQIPGESMAVRLAELDSIIGYNPLKIPFYSNQYIPPSMDVPIYERIKIQGEIDGLTSGGAILHVNVDDEKPLTEDQFYKTMDTCRINGCKYFAINYCYSECKKGHYIIGKVDVCTICKSDIIKVYTRVVGFLTAVQAWIKVRKTIDYTTRIFYKNNELNDENSKIA